jgi:hypothetical protein
LSGCCGREKNIFPQLEIKLTSWSLALLEKPPTVQLLKNFPTFSGT